MSSATRNSSSITLGCTPSTRVGRALGALPQHQLDQAVRERAVAAVERDDVVLGRLVQRDVDEPRAVCQPLGLLDSGGGGLDLARAERGERVDGLAGRVRAGIGGIDKKRHALSRNVSRYAVSACLLRECEATSRSCF
jgi:hypothetical protein